MRFTQAIDLFLAEAKSTGQLNGSSERTYRFGLTKLAEDIGNRDPRTVGKDDIRKTLARWKPNSQSTFRSIFISFFDWAMQSDELNVKDNPARRTKRPKRRPSEVYRLTRDEAIALLGAVQNTRERRVIYLGLLAGLRNAELRGLQGRHFMRDGFIWVDATIAKGNRERWVPVLAELEPVVQDILATVGVDEYVIPSRTWADAPLNSALRDLPDQQSSGETLRRLVAVVAKRAGIAAHIYPHLMRHAYGDHIARFAGMRNAQFLMGHAGVATTERYVGKPTLDDLAEAIAGFRFATPSLPPQNSAVTAVQGWGERKVRETQVPGLEPFLRVWLEGQAPKVQLYADYFRREAQSV